MPRQGFFPVATLRSLDTVALTWKVSAKNSKTGPWFARTLIFVKEISRHKHFGISEVLVVKFVGI